ncbi:FtsW/RodA/SpoVE family cell cycle protein [Kitasatospora sp. NBC_01266]|uniref:FtsW/RodA/SpoVE family cell cycle protein n=1 Tax=Kitasatospora sp. NBC_01266 TaxID=2903572 RepID=UPI002E353820|nr:FtsW/RodA/SpoVE family cell cycle protein [Kitasatospora sp. NBC_01266]
MIGSQRTEGQRAADRRRNVELALLGFAFVVSLAAYIDADEAMNNKMPPGLLVYGVAFGVLILAAHLVMRRYARYADPLILPCAVLLSGVGLVLLHRLDESDAIVHAAKGDFQKLPSAPSQVQWLFLAVPAALCLIVFIKHHRFFQRYVYIVMVGALVLQIAPAFFASDADYGAKRWIHLPGITVEPDEFVKLAICIFFAGYLTVSRDALALVGRKLWGLSLPRGRNAGPVLAIWVISLLVLIFERDLGTSLIFFGVFVVMLYVATERTSWVVIGVILAVGGAAVVGTLEPHVHSRVEAWLNPMDYYKVYPKGVTSPVTSDQQAQSLFSFGSGHILGTGLGQGHPWLIGFADRSDFIFTTVGEELGLVGVTAVLMVYVLFFQRGLKTALTLTDPFGKLLATGLASVVALQVFVVVGGVTGLIPLTGKELPFLAAGGSTTLANWLLTAVLLKLSDAAGRIELEPEPEPSGSIAPPKPAVVNADGDEAAASLPGQQGSGTSYGTPVPYGAPTVHGTASGSSGGTGTHTVVPTPTPAAGTPTGSPGTDPVEQPSGGFPSIAPGYPGSAPAMPTMPAEQPPAPGYPAAGWGPGYPAGQQSPGYPNEAFGAPPAQSGYPAQGGYPTGGQAAVPQPFGDYQTGNQPEYLSNTGMHYPPHPDQDGTTPAF